MLESWERKISAYNFSNAAFFERWPPDRIRFWTLFSLLWKTTRMIDKYGTRNKFLYLNIQWTDLKKIKSLQNFDRWKFSREAGSHDTAHHISLRERQNTWTPGRNHVISVWWTSGKTDFSVWNVEWPAPSQDLSPLDFFIWGYLMKRGYQDNPPTVTELKESISKNIRCIGSEVTKVVIDSMKKRAQDCIQSGCHHLKSFVFEK